MFNDPVSLVWIYFLESQMKVCSISMKKIQSDSISGSEVAVELDILSKKKMKSKRDENFHTTKLILLISDVEDVYSNEQLTEVAISFYHILLLYLEKWSNNVLLLDMFHWTLHKNPPTWEKILHSTKYIANVDKNITNILDEDGLLDAFIHIANISKTRMDEWNTISLTTFERWSEIFEFVQSEPISLKSTGLILEFSFAVPGTSAAIHTLFPITNSLWTDEKSRFIVDTMKAVIVTKTHFERTFEQ
jgi:hypothetical protein